MPTPAENQHQTKFYSDFKFRVKWNGRYVAGVKMFKTPAKTTNALSHHKKETLPKSRKFPGQLKYDAIILEQGIACDAAFIEWARKITGITKKRSNAFSFNQRQKDIVINIFNEAGQKELSYALYRCWVSAYQALPDMEAGNTNSVRIQTITLENEGWERVISTESGESANTEQADD